MSLEERIGHAVLDILRQSKGSKHRIDPDEPDTITTTLDADAGRLTIGRPDVHFVRFQIRGVPGEPLRQLAAAITEALRQVPSDTLAPTLAHREQAEGDLP